MATTTKAVLRNRVLEELGVLAGGETAASEDAAVVDARIELISRQAWRIGRLVRYRIMRLSH